MRISFILLMLIVLPSYLVSAKPFFEGIPQAFGKAIGGASHIMGGVASSVVDGFKTTINGWKHTFGLDGYSNDNGTESKVPDAPTKPEKSTKTTSTALESTMSVTISTLSGK